MWLPKSVNKIFPSQRNKNGWKILVATFSLRIRMKRTPLGPQWRFFQLTNKINTNTLIIYKPSTEKPRWMNQMLVIYAVSCDCLMFQVFLFLLMHPTERLPFGSLLYVQNDLYFRALSRWSMDHQVPCTRAQPSSISCPSPLNHPQYIRYGKLLKKHNGKASHWS